MQQVHEQPAAAWPQILIMEDEVSVARGLEMALADKGYAVDLAMNGRSALDSCSRKMFDLLVADLRLPDIDGMEVIRQVKRRRPATGVLVITGYSTVPSAVEALKLGASDYLAKPFTEDEFIRAVRTALDDRTEPVVPPSLIASPPEDLQRFATVMGELRQEFSGARENLVPILHRVQDGLGYIPVDVLPEIAEFVGISSASVYGVATFYERFRLTPVGRHVVRVCRGTACHVRGTEQILSEIENRFQVRPGETCGDRSFTLETVACFGSCAIAPVLVIDETVHARVDPGQVKNLLHRLAGEAHPQHH